MSKITLNFFGEIISVDKPKSLASLRSEIARLFCLSSQDSAEIIITYNENGIKKIIANVIIPIIRCFLTRLLSTSDL